MPTRILHHCKGHGFWVIWIVHRRHQKERARSINQRWSMTENPFRKLPLVLLLNQYQLLNQPQYQQGDLQHALSTNTPEPNNQPPNETALQLLHTGTYFGESIGLSCRANSPATVGLLLLDLTFPHPHFCLIFFFLAPRPTATCGFIVIASSRPCLTGRDTTDQTGIKQPDLNQLKPNQNRIYPNQPILTFSPTKLKIVPIFHQTAANNQQRRRKQGSNNSNKPRKWANKSESASKRTIN